MHKPNDLPASYFELLRRFQVQKKTGLTKSGIYTGVKEKTFPSPVKIGLRAVAWRKSEIDNWIKERPQSKELEGENG